MAKESFNLTILNKKTDGDQEVDLQKNNQILIFNYFIQGQSYQLKKYLTVDP